VKRCPANAGQSCIFARHRNVLSAQWIPSNHEHGARQSLYVLPPVSAAFEWLGSAAELETFWKLLVNLAAYAPELETCWKLFGNFRAPDCLGRQMADAPSILSARLTHWHAYRKRQRLQPRVRHFLYVPLPDFRWPPTGVR